MPAWIGVLRIAVAAFGLAFYAGWGLTYFLASPRFQARIYLLMPFVGLFLIDGVSHLASWAGAPARTFVWIVAGMATLLNGAVVARPRSLRWPNRLELSVAACALPAPLLGVAPILLKGRLLPIGDSNGDPISYSAVTSFLLSHGMDAPITLSPEHPVLVPTFGILHTTNDRLGFEFFQALVNVLSGSTPPESFSVVSALGLLLWSLAAGFTATTLVPSRPAVTSLTTLLFSLSAFPLWIAYGGYGSQVLGMGLLIMAFNCWAVAVEERGWRSIGLAAVLSAALAGTYSDCLPYLVVSVLAFSLGFTLFGCGAAQWRGTAVVLAAGAAVSLLINPIGWGRAVPNLLRTALKPGLGNVDWMVDLRQVAGMVPFDRDPSAWFGPGWMNASWLVVAGMSLLAFYGFVSLSDRGALMAACFIAPHLASLAWFSARGNPYGYFKAWSIGCFAYLLLIAAGLTALKDRRGAAAARPAVALALSAIVAGLGVSSAVLAGSMTTRFACTADLAELPRWTADLEPEAAIHVSTGRLPPVSSFWIAYYLRDHALRFDTPVLYTAYAARPFSGEPWVIRCGRPFRNETLRRATVVRENDTLSLLSSGSR